MRKLNKFDIKNDYIIKNIIKQIYVILEPDSSYIYYLFKCFFISSVDLMKVCRLQKRALNVIVKCFSVIICLWKNGWVTYSMRSCCDIQVLIGESRRNSWGMWHLFIENNVGALCAFNVIGIFSSISVLTQFPPVILQYLVCSCKLHSRISSVWHKILIFSLFTGIPRYLSQPEAALVRVGDNQVLSCEVIPDLVPFIQWEKNKELVQLDERVFVLASGALVISNATEADAGLYRCVIENAGPIKTSEEAEIQILPGRKSQWYFIFAIILQNFKQHRRLIIIKNALVMRIMIVIDHVLYNLNTSTLKESTCNSHWGELNSFMVNIQHVDIFREVVMNTKWDIKEHKSGLKRCHLLVLSHETWSRRLANAG